MHIYNRVIQSVCQHARWQYGNLAPSGKMAELAPSYMGKNPQKSANFANLESWQRPKSPTKMALAKRRMRVNTNLAARANCALCVCASLCAGDCLWRGRWFAVAH